MSRRLVAGLVLLFMALATTMLAIDPGAEPLPVHPFWSEPGQRVIAHRGGRGLWPENTLHAFRNAAALGVDVLEMDLRQTMDDQIVVLHDQTVDRTTDGHGSVAELTVAELQRLDAGYSWTADAGRTFPFRGQGIVVPTLRQVFAALPQARMNVEIKGRGTAMAVPLCALIREHEMARRVAVVAVDQEPLDAFRRSCPEVATGATRNEVTSFTLLSTAFLGRWLAPRAQMLQVPERLGRLPLLTQRFLRDAQRLNVKVEVWTINEPDDMRRLLALPVDGIMTDFPDRLLPLVHR